MNKKIICFDIDNVICKTAESKYSKSKPKKNVIKLINRLYDDGNYIKFLQPDTLIDLMMISKK